MVAAAIKVFVLVCRAGGAEGMPAKEFKEQLSRFAREVMPAFSERGAGRR
jgi:hypothetical protein